MSSKTAKNSLLELLGTVSGLQEVEDLIESKIDSEARLLEEISEYLFHLGGKRIRPILTLQLGRLLGLNPPSRELIDIAAGIELIHMATLLHDDIIDKSTTRRHQTSPYTKYGMGSTLLAGNFLYVRAFSLCAHLSPFIIEETERACIRLTEGETLETSLAEQSHTLDSSLNISKKKTAALFELAAVSAGSIAGLSQELVEELRRFGDSLGVAFQILDDLLDVVATNEELGKVRGLDLRERKPSVVNVIWLSKGSQLATRLTQPEYELDEEYASNAIEEIQNSEVILEVRELARSYAEEARIALKNVAQGSPTVDLSTLKILESLIDYTIERIN